MATFTITNTLGATGRDYSSLASWTAVLPVTLTTTRSNNTGVGSLTTTIVLDASASGSNSFYNGHTVTWNGERLRITAYVGATKTATVGAINTGGTATWSGAPGTGEAFVVEDNIIQGRSYNDANPAFTSTAEVALTGFTTGSSNSIDFRPASGQAWTDAGTVLTRYDATKGVAIVNTGNFHHGVINVGQSFTTVKNLQLRSNASTTYGHVQGTSATGAFTCDNCLFSDTGCASSGGFLMAAGYSGAAVLTNNLIILNPSTTVRGPLNATFLQGPKFIGNTCVVPSDGAQVGTGVVIGAVGSPIYSGTYIDNAAFGFATFFGDTTPGTSTADYNAADIAITPGTHNQASKTYANQFTNTTAAALDLRPKAGNDLGANGLADSNITLDALGVTRPNPPTIGAIEYIAAAAGSIRRNPSLDGLSAAGKFFANPLGA